MDEIRKTVEEIIKKNGSIKLTSLQKEIEKGKGIVDSLDWSKLDIAKIYFNGEPKAFEIISNPVELIQFLSSSEKIRGLSEEYVSHYTRVETLKNILNGQSFYLNNPRNMNDGLEFKCESFDCTNLFFTSFSLENSENMGMWSMYGQPWNQGVRISIPRKNFIKWIDSISEVKLVDKGNKSMLTGFKPSISRVAYVESSEDGSINNIKCGEAKPNKNIKNIDSPLLAGYVKDSAWSYEKEIRLRVDLDKSVNDAGERVAVKIPDEIFEEMIITTGPRFPENYDLSDIKKNHEIRKSIYAGKLNYVYCDKCVTKKK